MELKFKNTTSFGKDCKMPIKEWLDGVECGFFIDYDGYGRLATDTQTSNVEVCPSDITENDMIIPEWATHIEWYNR